MIKIIKWLILTIYNILPDSPFQDMAKNIVLDRTYIQYLNWFLPLDVMGKVFLAWLDCILVYVVFSFVLWVGRKILSAIMSLAGVIAKFFI